MLKTMPKINKDILLYLRAIGSNSCIETNIIAPAAKAIKRGFKAGRKPTAINPKTAPAGSANPERKATLNKSFFFSINKRGTAIANSSGILWIAIAKAINNPKDGE